jgi:hypothetical protein
VEADFGASLGLTLHQRVSCLASAMMMMMMMMMMMVMMS